MQEFDFSAMNYIDYMSLTIIFISIIFGFYRGFLTSSISLFGWIFSIILTYQFYPQIEQYLLNYIKNKVFVIILGSGGLLIILLVIFGILNSIFYKLIGKLKRNFFDRMVGILFGLVRGFLIVSFLFLCFSISLKLLDGKKHELSEKDYPSAITEAVTFELIKAGADGLEGILPESFNKRFDKIFHHMGKKEVDERFIKNSIDKLSQFASDEQIQSINLKRQDLKSFESQETIEIKTLEFLLENYNKKIKNGSIKEKIFSKKEQEKLETIISNHFDE
ncbi:MAG: CvpA family protein [Candidatus Midichloriaceae bacterium]